VRWSSFSGMAAIFCVTASAYDSIATTVEHATGQLNPRARPADHIECAAQLGDRPQHGGRRPAARPAGGVPHRRAGSAPALPTQRVRATEVGGRAWRAGRDWRSGRVSGQPGADLGRCRSLQIPRGSSMSVHLLYSTCFGRDDAVACTDMHDLRGMDAQSSVPCTFSRLAATPPCGPAVAPAIFQRPAVLRRRTFQYPAWLGSCASAVHSHDGADIATCSSAIMCILTGGLTCHHHSLERTVCIACVRASSTVSTSLLTRSVRACRRVTLRQPHRPWTMADTAQGHRRRCWSARPAPQRSASESKD